MRAAQSLVPVSFCTALYTFLLGVTAQPQAPVWHGTSFAQVAVADKNLKNSNFPGRASLLTCSLSRYGRETAVSSPARKHRSAAQREKQRKQAAGDPTLA